jgi:solute carrier family 50 protein (sugar transporter)
MSSMINSVSPALLPAKTLFLNSLPYAGPTFALALQASSIKCALDILQQKDTKSLSSLPFASLVANSVIWTYYGILKSDISLIVPNGVGILSGLFCLVVFNMYSKSANTAVNTVLSGLCGVSSLLLFNKQTGQLGLIGCCLSVILLASPLATLGTVIREKSTAALPFPVSLAGWLNAIAWTLYGWITIHDPMVWGPSAIGTLLTSFQMMLFVIYGLPGKRDPSIAKDLL